MIDRATSAAPTTLTPAALRANRRGPPLLFGNPADATSGGQTRRQRKQENLARQHLEDTMEPRFRVSYLMTLSVAATFAITGCALLNPTPMTRMSEQDRQVVKEGSGEPEEVRLTKPATVAGVPLAPGSVVKNDEGRGYLIETVAQTATMGVTIPAGSSVEIKYKNDDWKWNGVLHVGGSFTYGLIPAEKGDTLYFSADWSVPQLTEARIKTARVIDGRSLPADSVIDLERDGKIKETYTPDQQRRCRQTCALITDSSANWQCRANCGGL